MTRFVWSVLCKRAITDKADLSISLIDSLERVSIEGNPEDIDPKQLPAVQLNCHLVSSFTRISLDEPEEGRYKVILQTASGKKFDLSESVIDLSEMQRIRMNTLIGAIPVSGPGIHEFIVQQQVTNSSKKTKWKTEAKVPLEVLFVDPPAATE